MQSAYPVLKAVHAGSAALSLCLFAIRGGWMMRSPAKLSRPWVKVVPHLVDTVLLASAIALTVMIGNYPGTHAWLTAKLVGLVLYIVLGSIALKRGRTGAIRVAAFFAALAVFGYIVAVAVTKSPAGPLTWIAG
jgi:uncharacterized membrane protein SirB2